jgi:hypothetical protein
MIFDNEVALQNWLLIKAKSTREIIYVSSAGSATL